MTTTSKKAIPAKVVEVDPTVKPIDAVVVGDKRDTLGKRLGWFAIILLLLFFAVNGYISAAQANRDRTKLINSVSRLASSSNHQTDLIKKLQDALRRQNKLLEKHHIQTVVIPGDSNTQSPQTASQNPPKRNKPGTKPKPKPKPAPSSTPTTTPPPKPPPPINKVRHRICNLTGICLAIDLSDLF